MIYCGIDPGVSGGISIIDTANKTLSSVSIPIDKIKTNKKTKSDINVSQLANIFKYYKPEKACLENVHSMPGQGVSSTFLFGKAFGIFIGILGALNVETTFIAPQKWKRFYNLIGEDKHKSVEVANEYFVNCTGLWPLKKHHGMAEASLICYFGLYNFIDNTINSKELSESKYNERLSLS